MRCVVVVQYTDGKAFRLIRKTRNTQRHQKTEKRHATEKEIKVGVV